MKWWRKMYEVMEEDVKRFKINNFKQIKIKTNKNEIWLCIFTSAFSRTMR
jgi:hypothetical protein